MKIYVYKMTTDNGGAPCVSSGLLSLAICKPMIRRKAERGSLVFGFGGKNLEERLIYIARVTGKLENDDYYRQRKYARRPDCIYHKVNGKPKIKRNARYHKKGDQLKHDVGNDFKKGDVLLSKDFRYFGKKGTANYQHNFKEIRQLVNKLRRGHRVNHSSQILAALKNLKQEVWKDYRKNFNGGPSDSDFKKVCNKDAGSSSHDC